jgi:hypothetical protein
VPSGDPFEFSRANRKSFPVSVTSVPASRILPDPSTATPRAPPSIPLPVLSSIFPVASSGVPDAETMSGCPFRLYRASAIWSPSAEPAATIFPPLTASA